MKDAVVATGSSICQKCSTRPSIDTVDETDNECNGPTMSDWDTGPIKIHLKMELNIERR